MKRKAPDRFKGYIAKFKDYDLFGQYIDVMIMMLWTLYLKIVSSVYIDSCCNHKRQM